MKFANSRSGRSYVAEKVSGAWRVVGEMFRSEPRRSSLFSETAVDRFMALIGQVGDPDEILRQAGITRQRLRAITADDEISGAMDTRRDAVIATPWQLQPLDNEGKALKRSELPEPVRWLWTEFERHYERIVAGCMEALPYGYSVLEAVYRYADDGQRITFKQIAEKPFEWFIPQMDGTVLYKSMTRPQGEPTDPRKFFLTARQQTFRNPYGEALFSRLYWVWFFRTNGWKFWVKWLERFGTPLLVGMTTGNAADMAKALSMAVQDAAVAVGAGSTVSTIEQSSGSGHFEGFERACCGRIQKLILGQTLTTDAGGSSGNSGSYALGKVHEQVRQDKRDSDIRMVRPVAQRIVDVLWALNGFPGAPPTFVMQDQTGLEMERADRDAKTYQAGARFTPSYWTRVYDYEAEDLDNDAMKNLGLPKLPALGPGGKPGQQPPQGNKGGRFGLDEPRFTPEQQAIEDGIEERLDDLRSVITDAEVKAAIRSATSPQDLHDKLFALLPDAPPADFRRLLERALFAADILGYVHAEERA